MKKLLELSSQQKNVWNSEMFYSNTNINNIGGYLLINEPVNIGLLEKAANIYIKTNEALRLHFNLKDGEPVQCITEFTPFKLKKVSVKNIDEIQKLTTELVSKPFEVINSNLYSFTLFKMPDGKGGIVPVFHHLISDAWSCSLFITRFINIYTELLKIFSDKEKTNLLSSSHSNSSDKLKSSNDLSFLSDFKDVAAFNDTPNYSDYITSCNEYKQSNRFIKDKEYWEKTFDKSPELTYISHNKSSNNSMSRRKVCSFDDALYDKILDFCKDNKCSIYTFFMAIFSIYLAKVNSASSAILGTPVLNRSNFKEKNTSGMFVSTVPFKIDLDFNINFKDFLDKAMLTQASIFRHQKYPYLELLENIKEKYNISENLYDFVLSYQNARDNKESSSIDYRTTWEPISHIAESIEAHFYDMDGNNGANILYDYQVEKFNDKDIQCLHKRICHMAEQALQNVKLKDISVLCDDDEKTINEFNDTDFDYDKNETLVNIFEKTVKANANKTAYIFKGQTLTYKELDEKSNILANYLISKGISKNDVIGIMFNRSLNLPISIWGVLKTGAAYMLIDPSLPQDRINYMLTNANAKYVLTNLYINYDSINIESILPKVEQDTEQTLAKNHNKSTSKSKFYSNSKNVNSLNYTLPKVDSSNEDRFCIIYTSGSTGTPKGVELKRIGVINMVNSYKKIMHTGECNVFLSTSTVAFDMFIVENFASILDGKTVVLADEDEQKIPVFTSKLITEYNADFILSTPSKITLLLEEPKCLKNVKVIQLGGEVFKESLYDKLSKVTSARIYNGYGPSECTACSSNKLVTDAKNICIGKPFLNVKIYIMNNCNNILPIKTQGEIVITGDNVGKGYVNKYDFNGTYHSGDLGMISENGELIYFGRRDNQIKLHGLRIELDEITSKIMQINGFTNAITVIKKVVGRDCICSYIQSKGPINETFIKSELAKSLPKYMVPSHIIRLDTFPITLNGKIDTKKLPEVAVKEEEFVACSTNIEKKLEKICKEIFNITKISSKANFFDMGADSLAIIRFVSEIYSKMNLKVSIQDIYTYPTIYDLGKYLDSIDKQNIEKPSNVNIIKKHKEASYYPVSSAQRRIFYTVNMDSNSLAYNTPFGIIFKQKPNVKKLEDSIRKILNSHDAFKTYFILENNDVVQKLVPKVDFNLKTCNYKNDDFIQPFDLGKAPLIHVELDHYEGKYLLQLDIHHIICDGSSISIFMKELCSLYNNFDEHISNGNNKEANVKYNSNSKNSSNKIDYIDYAVSEKILKEDEDYWVNQFKDEIPILNMPTEFERTAVKSYEGNNVYLTLNNLADISNVCKKYNVTPYMFLLACFYILLYKYTMQNDIVIGTPVIGRNNPELSDVIGMFVNTLAIRQNIQSANKFSDFLELLKNNCLNAYSHQTYPFDELVKKLNVIRDSSRSPIFDVLFTYESEGIPKFNFDGIDVEYYVPENKTSKFDFSLEVTPNNTGFNLRLEYCTKLFSKRFMQNLLDCYDNIIKAVINNNDIQISKIQMLSNIPNVYPILEYPKESTVIDLFEKQVKKTPNKTALIFGDKKYTYKELQDKVNRLAYHIRRFGEHEVVGMLMDRSDKLIISQLAILKSGAGYIPIDPTYPEERIKYIIEDSGVDVILTESKYKDMVPVKSILVDDENSYKSYKDFKTNQTPNSVAFLIYTSGSTGKPKGVMVKQQGVVNFICGMYSRMPLKNLTMVSITTMCFDIYAFESLLPLCTGMKVVMASNEEQNNPILLNDLCLKNKVDVIQTTPSKFKLLMTDDLQYLEKLKIISLAGEPFPLDLLKNIKKVTKARIYNMYGPTETTIGSTLKDLTNTNDITIGEPMPNTHIFVLDKDMNFVPYTVPGMLYIGGDGVSIGYKNRPELTSEKYVMYNGERIYNSGDLVKLLPNGELECLGRADFQVKLHGLRIELGEIETDICSYKGVKSAVVTVKKAQGRDILCGYFVADGRVSLSLLKKSLAKKLPNYMVPSYLVQLDSFKYTPNGKIDRKALPEPVFEAKEIIAPKTELENKILNIWRTILSIEEISTNDNFFDIGGDSLSALRMQIELMKNNYNVNYGDIFKNNTIHDLANFIENHINQKAVPTYTKKDFKKIDKLLKKNSTFKRMKLKQKMLKNVLLVGATGFLGIHVLAELLKIDDIKIYCLIRKDPSTSPENKLKRKFQYYFGSNLSNLFGNRLFVIDGDITNDNFGTSNEVYDYLGKQVQTVVNCAASVKHYGYYGEFEKINVIGVKNLVKFCEEFNKEFYQTSTISVSGNTMTSLPSSYTPKKTVYFGETNLFINQPLDNVYVRSKFEAEKYVLEEIANKKLKGLVLRIGNITNRYTDGKFQENSSDNAFLNRLKAFLFLKEIPKSIVGNYIEFSPVDKIAESIVVCMRYYTYPMTVLHLYNSNHLYINIFLEYLHELGYDINVVDDELFKTHLNNLLFNSSDSDKVSVLLNDLDKNRNLIYKTNLKITNKFTLKFLDKAEFTWPIVTKEYIEKILKNL